MSEPLLAVSGLTKTFRNGGRHVLAVDDIGFELPAGQTLGIVGASGSGKSTLARLLMRLIPADSGSIRFHGQDWLALSGARLRRARADIQMVFQDPLSAFNPRATVESVLNDPLRIHEIVGKAERPARIGELLDKRWGWRCRCAVVQCWRFPAVSGSGWPWRGRSRRGRSC